MKSAYTPKKQMTQQFNTVAALMKVGTAPLSSLDDRKLESIASSHARRGTPTFDKLLADLRAKLAERREREAA